MGSPSPPPRDESDREIRRADRADAPALAEIEVRSWRAAYRGRFPEGFVDAISPESRRDWWHEAIVGDRAVTLVGASTGRLVGFCRLAPFSTRPRSEQVGELLSLYVDPPEWGRGHGAALMDAAITEMRSGGLVEAVLWVLAGNDRAVGFYRSRGWDPDGRVRPAPWFGPGAREVRYRRGL